MARTLVPYQETTQIMLDSLYCEPCYRFLRGDVVVIQDDKSSIVFEHHDDYGSLSNALNLPCTICSLAWQSDEPSELHCARGVRGTYSYNPHSTGHVMRFTYRDNDLYGSDQVVFIPWHGECDQLSLITFH